ncbi:MAG: N-formylglutamate amidohydrolase [Planctomycetaceae bacterium]
MSDAWEIIRGEGPLVAAAIHDGHDVRLEVAEWMMLHEADRLREQDPHTGEWTAVAPTRIIGRRSRFEVDLNRPREKAVYRAPEDAWGLSIWRDSPPADVFERSLLIYDAFYADVRETLEELIAKHGKIIVLDLHTYNHRRGGPEGPHADPEENPEVNIGTGTLDRKLFGPVIDRFISDLRAFDYHGRTLDVRENVKFQGGHFSRFIHQTFPGKACVPAIEFKKFFMDEWNGEPDPVQVDTIRRALESAVPGLLEELGRS